MSSEETAAPAGSQRLALLLAMAMFVLVVDTSLMNVSIASVVEDLDTTVSDVQGAIALEALVSAAFILIGGKVGDLIGRKRAFVLGLLATRSAPSPWRSRRAWSRSSCSGRSSAASALRCCCPRCSRSSTATSRGRRRRRRTRSWAPRRRSPRRSGRCSAASSPPRCRGVSASWREVAVIAFVLSGVKLIRDVPYTGPRGVDVVGAGLSAVGMGVSRRRVGMAGGRRVRRRADRDRRGRVGRCSLAAPANSFF